tara:strand:- start:167 stop:2908 length:2742 start_codon:yes stop_codon:yes gene_type:complete
MHTKLSTSLLLVLLFHFSLFAQNSINYIEIDSSYVIRRIGDSRENYTGNSNLNTDIVAKGESIVNNYIYLENTWPPYEYKNDINWEINPFNNTSWLNYLFSLRMLATLAKANELDPREEYLIKGKEILYSWDLNYKKERLLSKRKVLIWNDHSVANRVVNLCYFYYVLKHNNSIDKRTKTIISKHLIENAEWLYDNKNYTWGNHAVMMDRALLYVSYILNNYERSSVWRQRALKRFDKIINEEVSINGVCVENSPQYHPFMMNLVDDFIQLLDNFGEGAPSKYKDLYQKMKTYLVYVLKPDLVYPFQGDTYPLSSKLYYSNIYTDSRLEFIESNGTRGEKPKHVDMIYKDAGYAILRDSWKEGIDFPTSTYLNFTTGFLSRVHKHSDNLSFVLYANEENLLIDPGSWGYSKNDTVSYLKSTLAHNTFTINETNYQNFPLKSCKILSSKLEEDYSIIRSVFTPNPYEQFYRTLIFIKPNVLIVDDYVYSEKSIAEFSQVFNLGLSLNNITYKKNSAITANFKNNKLDFQQLINRQYSIREYNGTESTRGLYALMAEKSINGSQLVYSVKPSGTINEFYNRTLITIKNNLPTNCANIEYKDGDSSFNLKWINREGKKKELDIDKISAVKDFFAKKLIESTKYSILEKPYKKEFCVEALYVKKWGVNEYSLIFKMSGESTEEQLKLLTLGIKGEVFEKHKELLSTYSRHKKRNYETWNIKEYEFIKTPEGKFLNLNITTKIPIFKNLKIFLFDRSGYTKTLWKYQLNNFYIDNDTYTNSLINSITKTNCIANNHRFINDFNIEKTWIVKNKNGGITLILKLEEETTDVSSYRIGFHTYPDEYDMEKLSLNSKKKKRKFDIWDFTPEISQIDNVQYIVKNIPCKLTKLLKLKLFVYDRAGYNGIIGNPLEVDSIIIE